MLMFVAACAVSTQVTKTSRSSIEQQLLVSSLERGFDRLNTQRLNGASVSVEFFGLTPDKDFAKEFLIAWLQAHQVQIVTEPRQAQVRLKVFAPVLAVDQAQSFVGAPSFTVPFLGVTMPEIPLFRTIRHSGHVALETYFIDEDSGTLIEKGATAIGHSEYNDYTILILLHFTNTDLEKDKWDWGGF
ncbi:MAG: hypothetical protein ACTHLX_23310 [Candidatus Binatia bacterium]